VTDARTRRSVPILAMVLILVGVATVVVGLGSGRDPSDRRLRSTGEPDFGPAVTILDSGMDPSAVQSAVDDVFAAQETNQFGERRDAILFKPGVYDVTVDVGFYTSVSGLGLSPDDVVIEGDGVRVDADWFEGNATQNFWRSVENLSTAPRDGTSRWAVSQAAPMRRVHVRGGLDLFPTGSGWASGGYLADTRVDGAVSFGSQQQYYSRGSEFGFSDRAAWNTVFSGVRGAPASDGADPALTVLETTPRSREKPFLYVDSADRYRVFLPGLRDDAAGVSWADLEGSGSSLPIDEFHIARPTDDAETLNAALSQGLNLLLTPGVYHLDETLRVTRPDTVVLGIGLPTLIPDDGVDAMTTADVDGLRLAGFLIDAGPVSSDALLTIGTAGSTTRHSEDPTTVQDVYFRVGGAGAGRAVTSLVVHSADAIVDHVWAWRADHGEGVGWEINTADTGVVVDGRGVLATGLFVEHFQEDQVRWDGEDGATVFFQNEMPYDPPGQAAWRDGATDGYAAYRVGDEVARHEVWGAGNYCYFSVDPDVRAARAFAVPDAPGVRLHDVLTVSLGGTGSITNVVNRTGSSVGPDATGPSYVPDYG
jgi:hypothetical protein